MTIRFLADADFNNKIVAGVRRREPGIDFLDAGRGAVHGLSDPEVLAIAAATGRVLVSHDRSTMLPHFLRFIQSQSSPGLVIVSQDLDIGSAIDYVLLIWGASDAQEWRNTVIFVPF
jgi:hypothetical protein